jgi:Fe2+ transport system protein B
MGIKIALAGNPNSGKTTMFNELTGSAHMLATGRVLPLKRRKAG